MIIHEIFVEGYSSYYKPCLVKLPIGITGIVGKYDNHANKSNGSGKSSLIMAIIYALYGEGEFATLEELVNDNSDTITASAICASDFDRKSTPYCRDMISRSFI